MLRDPKVLFHDVLDGICKISRYTEGMTSEHFHDDEKTVDAVVRNLEIIGEAVKQVPENLRDRYTDVDWQRIAGLRDVLIHGYFGVDLDIVWDIVQNKLPVLQEQVSKIIAEHGDWNIVDREDS